MDSVRIKFLRKTLRLTQKALRVPEFRPELGEPDFLVDAQGQAAGDLIRKKLLLSQPCMISRWGSNELFTVLRGYRQRSRGFLFNAWRYVRGKQGEFWWDDAIRHPMQSGAGFFPITDEALSRFADSILPYLTEIDVLGSWCRGECELRHHFPDARIIPLQDMEPYFHRDPWTTALANRKVLVIHPFEISIRRQYERRALLFRDSRVLPDFTLVTFRSVQSAGGNGSDFATWFDALDWMCGQIRNIEFDVAIIGAGAYGLPLAAYVKSIGKKAVHLGGATQILFGIRGRRWDERPLYCQLYNQHWTRPLPEETPRAPELVEGGCYW